MRHAGIVLAAIICGCLQSVSADELCRADVTVHTNRPVHFDGVLYTDLSVLKARLMAYRKHTANCFMRLRGDKDVGFKSVNGVDTILQEAGFDRRIDFLTEPRNTP